MSAPKLDRKPPNTWDNFVAEQAGKPRKTIEDALAQRVEARRDAASDGG